ncbi:MAG: tetratricopeptide repeat protein [Gemmatimonadetes bacterium]|nr:tetratricopeptide repeat protein [Gemmatimonadota bacterium]
MIRSPNTVLRAAAVWLALPVLLVQAGCVRGIPDVGPEDIPRLEQAAAAAPGDLDIRTQLGMAYYRAERHAAARTTLGRAVEEGASSGAAYLFLGLANEALEDWAGAREAYSRYLEVGRFDPLKDELRGRLALIVRNELRQQAQMAIQQEGEISTQPPTPRSVAVLPLRFVGENEELAPLQVALADMMITDLGLVGSVTVLERSRVQSLIEEMALTEAGYADPASGTRAGRLLRAENVIQGVLTTLGREALRIDAAVLDPQAAATRSELTNEGALNGLFDLEKRMVFSVLDALGIQLTPGEREAINENRAENILAFLAYGRGLQALDRGDYAQASAFFQQAVQLDPNFGRAQQQSVQAAQLQAAAQTSPQQITQRAGGELRPPPVSGAGAEAVAGTSAGGDNLLQQTANEIVPTPATQIVTAGSVQEGASQQGSNRNAAQEGQGQEGVAQTATFTIRIRRP